MDINELREQLNQKSDDELLGILTRRDLYSPTQIDIVIEILKRRREGGRPLGSSMPVVTPASSEPADDHTSIFNPREVQESTERAQAEKEETAEEVPEEKPEEIQPDEKKGNTEELPKVSQDYIDHQKSTKAAEVPPKKKGGAGIIVASVISGLIILTIILGFIFRPGVGLFISSFESEKYENAHFLYKWCSGNGMSLKKINDYFAETAMSLTDSYLEGEIEFEEAEKRIAAIKFFDPELGEKYLEELNNAENAEQLFEEGEALISQGEYYDAIKAFMGIYPGYKKYDLVEEKIEKCKALLKGDLETKMQKWLEDRNFDEALAYIESIKDVFADDPEIASYENAIAEQLEAQKARNKSAEEFYEKGGNADISFRDESGLTYPSKKIVEWNETGTKVVIEFGTVGSRSQLAFAVFADLGNGIEEIFSYTDAVYNIYDGSISTSGGKIVISGKINSNGGLFTLPEDYTDVNYTLKFDGEKAYLG